MFGNQDNEATCIGICKSNLPTFEKCTHSTFNTTEKSCKLYESLTKYVDCQECKTNEKACEPVKCKENLFWLVGTISKSLLFPQILEMLKNSKFHFTS